MGSIVRTSAALLLTLVCDGEPSVRVSSISRVGVSYELSECLMHL
jgi:hypothetical protein